MSVNNPGGVVTGTFSATLAPFAPNGSYAVLNAGTASSNVALPTGTVVEIFNAGTNAAFVNLGTVATTTEIPIGAGSWLGFAVGANTNLAAITGTGTSELILVGGAGLPVGAVAGAASSGSGGNVNITQVGSAAIALGQTTEAASFPVVLPSNQTVAVAGTISAILLAGAALAGKFGIDQTTPGATNGVVVNSGTLNLAGTSAVAGAVTIGNTGSVTLLGTSTVAGSVGLLPSTASAGSLVTVQTTLATENGHVFSASATSIYDNYCVNNSGTAGFYFLLNASSVPSNGTLSANEIVACIPMGTSYNGGTAGLAGVSYGTFGKYLSTGAVGSRPARWRRC